MMTGIGSIRIVSCMKGTGCLALKKEMCRLQGPTQLCRIAEFRVVCPGPYLYTSIPRCFYVYRWAFFFSDMYTLVVSCFVGF